MSGAPRPTRLPTSALRRHCDPNALGFRTTDELEPFEGLIGQERAIEAIDLGARMEKPGFNLFVLGSRGSARHYTVGALVERYADALPKPADWIYVHNFAKANQPHAIALPSGRAAELKSAMDHVIDELITSIPAVFDSDEYQTRRHALEEDARERQEKSFETLNEHARAQHIAFLRTPVGFTFAPMADGQVLKPEAFNALSEDERNAISARIEGLQKELATVLESVPRWERERRAKVRELDASFASVAVKAAMHDVGESFADLPEVAAHLKAVTDDMIRRASMFRVIAAQRGEEPAPGSPPVPDIVADDDPRFRRYRINPLVSNGAAKRAPIVIEDNPSVGNLIGRIESQAIFGALTTDFTLIRPGSLHRANGGFLMLDARRLLMEPLAWEALKRALRARKIAIEAPFERSGGVGGAVSLEPDPIPLSVKIVLVGDRTLYYLLADADPDFGDLFKIAADFEDAADWTDDTAHKFARLIASIARHEQLRPLSASAVARMIEEQSRNIEDTKRLSLHVSPLADLLRESDFWARQADHPVIDAIDVDKAIVARERRQDRVPTLMQESIDRGIVLVDTSGEKVGQINGLSVLTLGGHLFGKPSRITARVRVGGGQVIDVEREVLLGGPLHSKGVLILSAFLSARYALDRPPSLHASIVFEQSYGGVDGDSASSAELYTLLSALADVPIRQCFAVTGSVNQRGEVQAIGGVNHKIEGFFDVCRSRELDGKQGVLIPASNVQHLMLRRDVIEAVSAGRFNIYPVSTIDQGIEILTGIPAGERGADGRFPENSINRRVEDRLIAFSEARRRFGQPLDVLKDAT
ncbi:MAG: AAA family ATPase [Alphaproteobacteria bacterium]|nr:AAA family ATPase [Alphaproteobacteria bacterium]